MEILTGVFEDPDGNQLLPRTDVLDTEEEIKANTESGKAAGAQVVKQVISDLGGFTPVIDPETGEMTGYKTGIGGADTVFPFKRVEYVTSEAQEKYSSGSFTFPGDYSQCYLVVSISRLGTGTHLTNPVISNESATFEELYSNVHKNSQNTAGDVGHRTLVFKFQNVKKGDVFSFGYTERSKGHVSLFA